MEKQEGYMYLSSETFLDEPTDIYHFLGLHVSTSTCQKITAVSDLSPPTSRYEITPPTLLSMAGW